MATITITIVTHNCKTKRKDEEKNQYFSTYFNVPLNEINKWCKIGSHLLSLKPNTELGNTN
jgi:hypothetical protein